MSATPLTIPIPFCLAVASPQEPPSAGDAPSTGNGAPAPTAGPDGTGQQASLQQDPNGGDKAPATGFDSTFFLIMLGGIALMLFFSSRGNSKAKKAHAALLASIKQGDVVVTSSGIHGTVHQLGDTTVTLLLDSAQVTFERSAIARVLGDPDAKSA